MSASRRVAIDLLYVTGRRGGTETYARELLPRMAPLLDGIELVGLTGVRGHEAVRGWFPGPVRRMGVDAANRASWAAAETALVARTVARCGADLLWCPANYGPVAGAVPRMVTVHDVIPFEYAPPGFGRVGHAVTRGLLRRAARGATRILTVSEDAARHVTDVLGVPRERISVVPNGASRIPVPADPGSVVAGLGVPAGRPFVLSTGNRMPHKNFETLVRALAMVPRERRPALVVTGGPPDDPLRPLVDELGLAGDVVLPGWVSGEALGALHHGAALYVCPSRAEGFGMPVLDAMRMGCPVLASDIDVLREVGGDAAAYVDTTNTAVLAGAIDAILADADGRARMREAGTARAAGFTWDRSAKQAADVVLRMLAGERAW